MQRLLVSSNPRWSAPSAWHLGFPGTQNWAPITKKPKRLGIQFWVPGNQSFFRFQIAVWHDSVNIGLSDNINIGLLRLAAGFPIYWISYIPKKDSWVGDLQAGLSWMCGMITMIMMIMILMVSNFRQFALCFTWVVAINGRERIKPNMADMGGGQKLPLIVIKWPLNGN